MSIVIELTKGKEAKANDCDSHLSDWKWFATKAGYAARKSSRRWSNGKQKQIYMHHLVVGFPLNGLQVDHINGDGLDNRRENLRIVSCAENQRNQSAHRNGKDVGVGFLRGKWRAHLGSKHIGCFETKDEAKQARIEYLQSCR